MNQVLFRGQGFVYFRPYKRGKLNMEVKEKDFEAKWRSLGITNDFIFNKVMQSEKLCKHLLELVLGVEIEHIEYVEPQKSIDLDMEAKGIRLDVYVADGVGTVYNIEMQVSNQHDLPQRSRYYQGIIDLSLIEKGQHYKELNSSYIIFICGFDPFGDGLHKYTFYQRCEENKERKLEDGTCRIFLNYRGIADDIDPELGNLLNYMLENRVSDEFTRELDNTVKNIKNSTKWRREYMTLDWIIRDIKEESEQRLAEKDLIITEKEVALAEKDTALAEKDAALAEKEVEKNRILAEKEKAMMETIRRLLERGMSDKEIQEIVSVDIDIIKSVRKSDREEKL